jgi:hypothetical protein
MVLPRRHHPLQCQATNRGRGVPGVGDDASANTGGGETRYPVLLLPNLRGARVAELRSTHNDKDVMRGRFLLYTGYCHNLAAHTGRIRGRTVDSAKENFLGHWYVTSSPVSSRAFTHIGVGSNSGQKDVFRHWGKRPKKQFRHRESNPGLAGTTPMNSELTLL